MENGIRIGKPCKALRDMMGLDSKSGFTVSDGTLDAMAGEHPTSYLGVLEKWYKALRHQTAARFSDEGADVFCAYVDGRGMVSCMTFTFAERDGMLVLTSVDEKIPHTDAWVKL